MLHKTYSVLLYCFVLQKKITYCVNFYGCLKKKEKKSILIVLNNIDDMSY